MLLDDTNFWALGAGMLIWAGVGGLWYAPFMFGKAWAAAQGKPCGQVRLGVEQLTGLLLALAAAFLIGVVIKWYGMAGGTVTWTTGTAVGLLLWLGGAWPIRTFELLTRRTGVVLYAIDLGNMVVVYALMGAVIGGWS